MSVRIKICGITRYEDARVSLNLGADALGFIFYPGSPRYIKPSDAARIIKKLPPFISKVGVFVNEETGSVKRTAEISGIDTVQLHGDESPEYCASMKCPVIKAFAVQPATDISIMSQYEANGLLLDTWDSCRKGGTGMTFDWSVAARACAQYPNIILAGGLGPSNIAEALEAVRPYAVDVNSGVEISPGIKNPYKIKDVIEAVKNRKDFSF